jgi:hypothetical protein
MMVLVLMLMTTITRRNKGWSHCFNSRLSIDAIIIFIYTTVLVGQERPLPMYFGYCVVCFCNFVFCGFEV